MWRAVLVLIVIGMIVMLGTFGVIYAAQRTYGPAAEWLGPARRVQYSVKVLWADGLLTRPFDPGAPEQDFEIRQGESVDSVCARLQQQGLVADARAMRDYLIYSGMDTGIQAGRYRMSASSAPMQLARQMQDATPAEVDFVILPGWRLEEIAAAFPTSGLSISPDEFLRIATVATQEYDFLIGAPTNEGFLFPDSYVVPRTTGPTELVGTFIGNFERHLEAGLRSGFEAQGLSVYEAVTLASIVERESVRMEEAPVIASVFLNRLRAGMGLAADPTVQYALGYDPIQRTWWKNPLTLDDLKVESPYNTYRVMGLPPSPIANPGLRALEAVAMPAATAYHFFSARCDESGFHNFAESFEAHLANICP